MKRLLVTLAFLLLMLPYGVRCGAQTATGNLNFFYGWKGMSSKWDSLGHDHLHWDGSSDLAQQPGEYGIELDIRDENMPVNIVVGVRSSYRDHVHQVYVGDYFGLPCTMNGKYELRTSEVHLGLKSIVGDGPGWNAFFNAGVSFAQAELNFSRYDYVAGTKYECYEYTYEDSGVGGWAGCGVYYTFGNALNVGCDMRYSTTSVKLTDLENGRYDIGGLHYGLMVGYHF